MTRVSRPGRMAPGVTMVEVLTAVGILIVLMTLLIVSSRSARSAARRAQAESQVKLLASAVERYAQVWPEWYEVPVTPSSDRGWPHWSGRWVFDPVPPPSATAYLPQAGFNDINARRRNVADDDDVDSAGNYVGRDDVEMSADVLAYALTASALGGPFLKDESGLFRPDPSKRTLPAQSPAAGGKPRLQLRDPWGNPYRYFWVARDAQSAAGWRVITSSDPGDPGDPNADPFCARANGFVIESAGPDGRFGNVWYRTPTAQQLEDAKDNLVVKP